MTIQAMLQDAGIQHAHVVDDAFDKAPGAELRPESVQGFLQTIDDEQFNVLATLLGIPEGTEDDLIPHLNTIAGTTILYDNKDLFGDPGRILFEEFTSSMGTEKDIITPLTDFLEEAGVKCHTFGRDYQIDEHPEPQMLFVDLKLNERKILTDQPIRVVKALKEHYPDAHPLVFLMSTANVALEANQELIRDKAELLSSQFEILHKKMFTTPQDLSLFLKHHVAVYRRLCKLQEHVSAWGAALDSAKEKMLKSLRRLDLADYFILHQNTVALEQVPLGTYVADLLLEYLAHQVEASPKIWEFTKDLDDWRLSEITRSRFNLEPVVGEIFSGNVFHSFQRVASEVERKRGPADGYFNLGDVFFLSSEITNNKVKTALVVLTPACDLVRPSVLYERDGSILLCEGEVESLKPTSTFNEIDGLHPIVLQYPEIGGHQYVIKWQKKRLQTWRKPEFDSFKDRENSFWSMNSSSKCTT